MNGIFNDFFPDFFSIDGGNYDDMVISSRVSLARNLQDFLFPSNLTEKSSEEVISRVYSALSEFFNLVPVNPENQPEEQGGKATLIFKNTTELSSMEANLLEERDILPKTAPRGPKTAIAYSPDKTLFVMVNFIDHLRLIGFSHGFNPDAPFEQTKRIAALLQQHLDFATDERFGYLSSQLSELGSGLNFQIILHLPALLKTEMCDEIIYETEGDEFKILPFSANTYTPNLLDPHVGFFALGNKTAFSGKESQQLATVKEITRRIMSLEVAATKKLKTLHPGEIRFDVQKAIDEVKSAKFLDAQKALGILSALKLAVKTETIYGISHSQLNRIFYRMSPKNLLLGISGGNIEFPPDIKNENQRVNYLRSLIFKECVAKIMPF
ncbi:MAG: hypothetical protein IIW10_00265 [Spirochaetaceae bacterium]|nr:hypothetical protein [Spirochaetaceae bacterium]